MINDPQLQSDGFVSLTDGVNGNLSPNQIPETSSAFAVNTTFRGGKPATRPGVSELNLQNGAFNGLTYFNTGFYQGGAVYHPTNSIHPARLIASFGGYIVQVNLHTFFVDRLFPLNTNGSYDNTFQNDPLAKAYFCQAENFMVIQNGLDTPLIYDGENLYRSGVGPAGSPGQVANIPIGTAMAYGQGRLFVTLPDGVSFEAGDLAYGGSTAQLEIVSSSAATNSTITTSVNHGFSTGDLVTISGHSSGPDINDDYEITVTGNTTFTIPATVVNTGKGGFATRVGFGVSSDLLRFTETTYLNEGGSLRVPSSVGRISGMTFMAVGNTNSGQGDLLVFCERGAVSFAVANFRDNWKTINGFQRVLFPDIGSVSDRSLVPVNGDLYFRSWDGVRSYRNAVSEQGSLGYVPLSAEVKHILDFDSPLYLSDVSSVFFDNRLLVTCSPFQDLRATDRTLTESKNIRFRGLVSYDFASITASGGRRSAVWEGVWAFSAHLLQLFTGLVLGKPKAFYVGYNGTSGLNELWEFDRFSRIDKPYNDSPVTINSVLETRSFSFQSPYELKRLVKSDFWISELSGRTTFRIQYRPDQYPCWVDWHSFEDCAESSQCQNLNASLFTATAPTAHTQILSIYNSSASHFRLHLRTRSTIPILFGATDSDFKAALVGAGIIDAADAVTRTGVGTQNSPYLYTVAFPTSQPLMLISPSTSSGLDGDFCEALQPPDFQPQYRTLIRLPAPADPPSENSCDPITGKPFRNGYEFQMRIQWDGYAKINKFVLHSYPLVEQVGAGCP